MFSCSNNAKSNKLKIKFFGIKRQPHGDFKLGSKEFWEISKNLDSDDEEESYNPNSQVRGPRINVKKSKW